jgi:hypothetical protein
LQHSWASSEGKKVLVMKPKMDTRFGRYPRPVAQKSHLVGHVVYKIVICNCEQ